MEARSDNWVETTIIFGGRVFDLFLLLFICVAAVLSMHLARKGKLPKIRKLAALDAIKEGVGRATEMGRPVFFSPGITALNEVDAPQTIAGLGVLAYVASLTAKLKAALIVVVARATILPVAEEVVRAAYLKEGQIEALRPEMVRYLTDEQFAYAQGSIGIMSRERAVSNIFMGNFMGESLILAEAGYYTGAIQIAGTANRVQIPFFVVACDYCLIGEELFAAGAYISQDAVQLGSMRGNDFARTIVILLILLGIVMSAVGLNIAQIFNV